ncbi:hypothetical protein JYB62_02845 [Algoriphagus lutimaris]|uniref:hypothetical protein n=1 Tax=Algoriphagus lutimaris TaxID=613197 RepID=UPI00196AEDD0|nr:hypothetical protein [Algoriphagus lutimaris]MBN3518927.1 hypothetical protein [Algoriphagus lutimaris]
MKESIPYLLIFLLVFTIVACQDKDDQEADLSKFREIAYNYLDDSTQETIIGNWKKAFVRKNRNGNYEVLFNTIYDALLGPIVIEIDGKTREVIGIYPRD